MEQWSETKLPHLNESGRMVLWLPCMDDEKGGRERTAATMRKEERNKIRG